MARMKGPRALRKASMSADETAWLIGMVEPDDMTGPLERHPSERAAQLEPHRPSTPLMTLPALARWGTWGWPRAEMAEVAIWLATVEGEEVEPVDVAPEALVPGAQSNCGPRAAWRG